MILLNPLTLLKSSEAHYWLSRFVWMQLKPYLGKDNMGGKLDFTHINLPLKYGSFRLPRDCLKQLGFS
jgi:hypothetical protein